MFLSKLFAPGFNPFAQSAVVVVKDGEVKRSDLARSVCIIIINMHRSLMAGGTQYILDSFATIAQMFLLTLVEVRRNGNIHKMKSDSLQSISKQFIEYLRSKYVLKDILNTFEQIIAHIKYTKNILILIPNTFNIQLINSLYMIGIMFNQLCYHMIFKQIS